MFTSNYARMKSIPSGLRPVAISIGPPRWYRGDKELRLAPTREMLSMAPADYNRLFFAILAKLDPRQVFDELGDNAVLLCWESPNVSCHRRAVAEWFERELGVVVPELGFERSAILPYLEMPQKGEKPKKAASAKSMLISLPGQALLF